MTFGCLEKLQNKLGTPAQLKEPVCSVTILKLLQWQIVGWTGLDCTALHWTGLDCTALHWTALDCTGLHWTALHWRGVTTTVHELCLRQMGLLSSKHCIVVSQTRHSWLSLGSCFRQPGEMIVNQRLGFR